MATAVRRFETPPGKQAQMVRRVSIKLLFTVVGCVNMRIYVRSYVTDSMTGRMRGLHKRLTKLEAQRKRGALGIASSREDIEQVALRKLSAADRDLLQSKKPGNLFGNLEDIQDQDLANRWRAALSAAWGEVGVSCIHLGPEELGWL